MRLNGRAAIMGYLGQHPSNDSAWRFILNRYGGVIRYRSITGAANRGYWVLADELNQVDKQVTQTV